jgi:hypothetical protein
LFALALEYEHYTKAYIFVAFSSASGGIFCYELSHLFHVVRAISKSYHSVIIVIALVLFKI